MSSSSSKKTEIKTDDKKQHFDDIYVAETPVPYKTEILDKLEYISDNFNREMFDAHILPWAKNTQSATIEFVDLCACFGNTTMATIYGMTYNEICDNWKDEESCMTITKPRRFSNCNVTAIDISEQAMAYGTKVGLYNAAHVCNLNHRSSDIFQQQVLPAMTKADIFVCTAALVYLDLESIEAILAAFASGGDSGSGGYVLVNFLNPFALEKADDTKKMLLKHLDFVGSRATRHRRLSPLEQSNYPGEEWALLELWVLKRRSNSSA